MSPSELEEYILQDPVPTLLITLASGDQIVVKDEDKPFVSGLALILRGKTRGRITESPRMVSIPNIVLVEPGDRRPRNGRRRR